MQNTGSILVRCMLSGHACCARAIRSMSSRRARGHAAVSRRQPRRHWKPTVSHPARDSRNFISVPSHKNRRCSQTCFAVICPSSPRFSAFTASQTRGVRSERLRRLCYCKFAICACSTVRSRSLDGPKLGLSVRRIERAQNGAWRLEGAMKKGKMRSGRKRLN